MRFLLYDGKKDFGCLGSVWSGKDCAATKRVWMLTKKAKKEITEYSFSKLPTLFMILGPVNKI